MINAGWFGLLCLSHPKKSYSQRKGNGWGMCDLEQEAAPEE
jgi:hypothetical protein